MCDVFSQKQVPFVGLLYELTHTNTLYAFYPTVGSHVLEHKGKVKSVHGGPVIAKKVASPGHATYVCPDC